MAASEPAPNMQSWPGDPKSSPDEGIQSLQMGISGMSLLSSVPTGGGGEHARKETGTTISSSPPDDRGEFLATLMSNQPLQQLSSATDHSSTKGSAPTSPVSDKQHGSATKSVSRPPGLGGNPLPSPIGKPEHSKNNSATSPLLTLTPNSSADGNADWHSLGRQQASPYANDAPPMPFLNNNNSNGSHRQGANQAEGDGSIGGFGGGSFDLPENENDGLLGLEALRERSHSSPGPIVQRFSNSPPVARGHFPPHREQQELQQRDERPRSASRDRPPLSQSGYTEGGSAHGERNNMSGIPLPFPGSSSRGNEYNSQGLDAGDSRGSYGAIARPDLRQSTSDYILQPPRGRASHSDSNYAYMMQQQHNQQIDQSVSHKFGSLTSLSTHIQQQRMPDSFGDLPKPRHVRTVSAPTDHASNMHSFSQGMQQQQQQQQMESRYFLNSPHQGHSIQGEGYKTRAASMSHPTMPNSFEGAPQYVQKRGSMPNMSSSSGYGQQPSYRREASLDFHQHRSPSGHNSGSVVATADEIRALGGHAYMSPSHSPMQVHYASHSRQPSDTGSMLSSSPHSFGSGGVFRGHNPHIHRRQASDPDDMAHPLIGEHIEVPDHMAAEGHHLMGAYVVSGGQGHPLMRTLGHGQSHSLEHFPLQMHETAHHLPTAGAALPAPKVVYCVKFKRTQRNFVLGPRINRDLKIGTYIKVEADRGEDLGIVVGKVSADKYNFSSRAAYTAGMGPPGGIGSAGTADLKRIIRLATHDEVALLSMKREEEEELLKICRAKVRQRGLPMNVVDAEYQFDRHKLTFFFEAEGRVDFRELVRDLFSMYKTRIWMQQLDKNTSTSAQAIVSPHPSSLQMDYGTPIIAPVSEFADSIVLGGLPGGDARSH